MATFSTPVLTIAGSPEPGKSIVKVEYKITFDAFDRAADQPYTESIRIIGDDTGIAGDPADADDALATFQFLQLFPFPPTNVVRASMIVAPATTLDRSHSRTFANTTLNEDQLPIPNPDEIRAVVTLTPKAPAVSGPRESNLVALAF